MPPTPAQMLPGAHVVSGRNHISYGTAPSAIPVSSFHQMSFQANGLDCAAQMLPGGCMVSGSVPVIDQSYRQSGAHGKPGNGPVMVESYRHPTGSKELMQQASDMLTATSHVLQDLSKQLHNDTEQASANDADGAPWVAETSPASVEIVDVTESVDDGSPEPDMSLPFPVVDLPFAV